MEAKIRELHEEGLEFLRLKNKSDNARYPDAGTPSYIISRRWLDLYKEWIFYDDCKYNQTPDPSPDHCDKKHPGIINNNEILNLEDKYYKGTGKTKDFPREVHDTYLHKDMRERIDYEFITEELWKWLKEKYNTDQEVKRFYTKQNSKYMYSTLT